MATRFPEVLNRCIGLRVIKTFPSCDIKQEGEVCSPLGANAHDLHIFNFDSKKKKKNQHTECTDEESSEENDNLIKKGNKKLFQIPKKPPEYLRPMREEREYHESLRGKYNIDWKAIHERAKMFSNNK